jgi:iron(III) transport system ATP-binding protein
VSALTVTGLAVTLGAAEVLRGLDLDVASGRTTAVLGPSGCGKTTLLRTVAGFVHPDRGEVRLDGEVVSAPGRHVPPERRGVALVPQEGALFPHLSVAENVAFGLPRPARRGSGRVEEMLALVGLPGLGGRRPHELSGGQQQRVALARALAPEPRVVLLDEPFSALDAGLRESVRASVREALVRSGTTAVVVTHDQDEALSLADEVAVLDDGRVLMHGPPHEVYTAPSALDVARFVGTCVELPAVVTPGGVDTDLGHLVLAPSSAAGRPPPGVRGVAVLRPEQLRLLPVTADEGTTGEVLSSEYFGHDALVRVRVGAGSSAPQVAVRALGRPPGPGPVRVTVTGPALFYAAG